MIFIKTVLLCAIVWQIFTMPLRFAGLNKKSGMAAAYIRIACLGFGWTGIGWLIAMIMAFLPNKKS